MHWQGGHLGWIKCLPGWLVDELVWGKAVRKLGCMVSM